MEGRQIVGEMGSAHRHFLKALPGCILANISVFNLLKIGPLCPSCRYQEKVTPHHHPREPWFCSSGALTYTFNPSTQEAETGGPL